MAKTVLFPTDFSAASDAAMPYATSLASDWGATLLIAHVIEGEKYPLGRWFEKEPHIPPEESAALDQVVPSNPAVDFKRTLLFDSDSDEPPKPENLIVKFAEEHHVDAIVMGTHGRTGLAHLLIGSVAEAVLRNATCPVVMIRSPKKPL